MLLRLLFVLRRRWPVVVAVPLLAAGAAYASSPRGEGAPTSYAATVTLAADQGSTAAIDIEQTVIDAEKGVIAAAAAKAAGGLTAEQAGARLDADFDDETFIVTLDVRGPSAAEADVLARAYADAFLARANGSRSDEVRTRLLEATRRRDGARSALDAFLAANAVALAAEVPDPRLVAGQQALQLDVDEAETELNEIEREAAVVARDAYTLVDVSEAEPATADALRLPDSVPVRVAMGLVLGALGAVLVIATAEKLNPRIDSPAQATALVGAPVLAMVPVLGRRHGRRKAIRRAEPAVFKGPFAEAFRSLRTHLEFRAVAEGRERPARIMVTSATPSEGKSTTAAFLALAFGEVGRPPVVVGGDLRRPSVHHLFGVARVPGLSSRVIGGGTTVALDEIVKVDPVTGVAVVPAGPDIDPVTGLLADVVAVTTAGQSAGRTVILDTVPVMVANDAVDFLAAVDWVVVVIRIGRSTERSVRQMVQTLGLQQATVVGVVMVGSIESTDAKRYYDAYYSHERSRPGRLRSAAAPAVEGPVTVSGTIADDGS